MSTEDSSANDVEYSAVDETGDMEIVELSKRSIATSSSHAFDSDDNIEAVLDFNTDLQTYSSAIDVECSIDKSAEVESTPTEPQEESIATPSIHVSDTEDKIEAVLDSSTDFNSNGSATNFKCSVGKTAEVATNPTELPEGSIAPFSGQMSTSEDEIEAHQKELTLPINEILYTKRSIPCCFSHVTSDVCIRLDDTIHDVIRNKKVLKKLPKLHVMRHDDKYWCVEGNRRLYVYRSLARIGYLQEVSVLEVEDNTEWYSRCCDTDSGGRVVSVVDCGQEARCNVNLCRKLMKEELSRRRRCLWCSWLVALSLVLAVSTCLLSGFAIHRNQSDIMQHLCEDQPQQQQPSTPPPPPPPPPCECPGVEICADLPIMEFIRMKWYNMTNTNIDAAVKDDL